MAGNLAHKHYENEEKMESKKLIKTKLGDLEYSDDDIVTLSSPILGFTELYDFLLITSDTSYPFLWFQSVEDAKVCFILIETAVFFPDYKPKITKRDHKILSLDDMADLKIFGIVVVPENPQLATVNLRAPLIVNNKKKMAKQIILDDDSLNIKTPLFKGK